MPLRDPESSAREAARLLAKPRRRTNVASLAEVAAGFHQGRILAADKNGIADLAKFVGLLGKPIECRTAGKLHCRRAADARTASACLRDRDGRRKTDQRCSNYRYPQGF